MKTVRQAKQDAQELWQACLVNGAVDPARVRIVVDQTIASNRTGTFTVLKHLFRRLRLDAARYTAIVASAAPLDAAVRGDVERALASQYGAAIATTFVVDPTLIGGMRVQVGSDLYDGSVKAGLAALESSF
jgi:F-type H+-transporting ATPase subunit delta